MGHAICSAVAGYYSKFKKYKQIVFIGDGGFMMNVQELNYIRSKKIPIEIIVLNNSSLGNTFLGTLKTFKKTYGNDESTGYTPPNIKSISNGFNIKYFSISNNFKINKKTREFLKERNSAILDVKISKYQDTAELDQIKSLEKIIYQQKT
jgi:acetolactate synthase-1/2/3 large subunit